MADAKTWARAFAQQAEADYRTYRILCEYQDLPACQRLHMLQMACEKLCKAHMFRQGGSPAHIQSTHSVIAKILPGIFVEESLRGKQRYRNQRSRLINIIRNMARELDLLAPAVALNAGLPRPENCEYPWDGGSGGPIVPAKYQFPNLSILSTPAGKDLLKIVSLAIDRYAKEQ